MDGTEGGDALALAMKYQLVTPISGAVVLETQAQYDAAGLQPVDSGEGDLVSKAKRIFEGELAGIEDIE